ncbi:MAG: BofC C-terminal domain-containing protein [Bacillota bacterium]|jgi:cell division protein FtsI/penicillin-binding protein 2
MKAWPIFNKTILVLLLIIAVTTAILAVNLFDNNQKKDSNAPVEQDESQYITAETPVRQEIYYNNCQHLVVENKTGDPEFAEKSFNQLQTEGWEVFWGENGQAVVFREITEFCPQDEEKCYLSVAEGRIAIFRGPLGSEQPPLEITDIYLDNLYPEMRDKIIAGIEFVNMDELIAALESLDEYR